MKKRRKRDHGGVFCLASMAMWARAEGAAPKKEPKAEFVVKTRMDVLGDYFHLRETSDTKTSGCAGTG